MGDHMKEWEVYKSLKRKFFLIWLFSVPAFFASYVISGLLFGKGSSAAILVPAVVEFILFGIFLSLVFRLKVWKCPRCHAAFQSSWRGIFTSCCANCGLHKYS
jgi:hypothetical protein